MLMASEIARGSFDSSAFVSEVEEFREAAADSAHTPEELERALRRIVTHAAMLDPGGAGFADAGISLKAALCAWLDAVPFRARAFGGNGGH